MLKSLLGSTTAKVTAVLFAAAIATGGLAAAGALSFQTVATTAGAGHSSDDVSGTVSDDPTSTVTATVGEDHESVTATAFDHDEDSATETVTGTVTPTAHESPDVSETAGVANHGHCVSFAAHNVEKMGLTGSQAGAFISTVARDRSAVSVEVSGTAIPDKGCVDAMTNAKNAVLTPAVTGTSHDGSGDTSRSSTSPHGGRSGRPGGSDGGSATSSGDSGGGGRG